jgi:short-subunit dehydrogenase
MLNLPIFLQGVGALFLTYNCFYKPFCGVYRHFIRKGYDLSSRYGQNSWVVITGGSDGIGKGYATVFAQRGFNLYLIARTEQKLQKLCQDLEKEYGIQAKYKAKDFTKSYQDGFFSDILEDTKKYDVSVLVNNVGMVSMKSLPDTKESDVKDVISTNTYPQAFLSQEFIRRMKRRNQKSAIISLSSFSGGKPISVCPIYSCTKGYNDFLSRALNYEFSENIDISEAIL